MATSYQNILLILACAGSSSILLSIILFYKNQNKPKANHYLTAILICFSIIFLGYISYFFVDPFLFSLIMPFASIMPFFIGPFLLYYLVYTHAPNYKTDTSFYTQFIPVGMAVTGFSIPVFIFLLIHPLDKLKDFPWFFIFPLLGCISLMYYCWLTYKLLKKYKTLLKNNYANLKGKKFKWLQYWSYAFLLFAICHTLTNIVNTDPYVYWILILFNIMLFISLILSLSYLGYLQAPILIPKYDQIKFHKKFNPKRKVLLLNNTHEIETLKTQLNSFFKNEKPYLRDTLCLHEVAIELLISDKKLAELLASHLNTNFFDFVNTYRIDAYRLQLKKQSSISKSLIEIAFDYGFNSKNSFKLFLKRKTGLTPTQFKSKIQNESVS